MISRRSSFSSSLILLLTSTTAVGSINTVFPVADSSWTIPGILRLFIDDTGITSRPSRSEGVTSLSMRPSSAALLSTERIILETLFCEIMISLLICAKLGEALSFTSPNRLIIESILFSILAKVKVSFTKFISEGNLFGSASEINFTNSRSVEIFFFNAIKSLVSKKVPSAFVSANC